MPNANVVISAEDVSKVFVIAPRVRSGLRHVIEDKVSSILRAPFRSTPTRKWRHFSGSDRQVEEAQFWALRDVSFRVQRGEIVGIIGRNGAGKSTLLKILSRITPPTSGHIKLKGRVASLLEVGTGFHPELTGRENIYLNGAILGMNSREIRRKFDEIVAFAEVERFLDVPVKRYSSGMYVRLAFSVAAHLEPEILIVDEVLAVGDAAFQKKCLGKMDEVSQSQGRTVLFVSHNMPAVTRLCKRAILLDAGKVVVDGPSSEVINHYLRSDLGTTAQRNWADASTAPGDGVVRLLSVRVKTHDGEISESIDIRYPVIIEMEYSVLTPGVILSPNLHFFNEEGVYLFASAETIPHWRATPRPVGRYTSTACIPGNFLAEGTIIVTAAMTSLNPLKVHFWEREVVAFGVIDCLEDNPVRGKYVGDIPGVVRPLLDWSTAYLGSQFQSVDATLSGELSSTAH